MSGLCWSNSWVQRVLVRGWDTLEGEGALWEELVAEGVSEEDMVLVPPFPILTLHSTQMPRTALHPLILYTVAVSARQCQLWALHT